MDYEKKYNEALEKAKNLYPGVHEHNKKMLEQIFPELRESEDERIRKGLVNFLQSPFIKENLTDEKVAPWIAYLEKQKEASKAIEAVDRIDKYIDDHLANAHDMKDSNPDKKYYRGWDDALGKMAGILQDVYSEKENKFAPRVLPCSAAWFEDGEEKQKEHRDYRKLYEDIAKSEWFKKAYVGKSLGGDDEQKEQKPNFDTHWENGSMVYEQKEQKFAEWKPQPESLEALMYAIEGKWEMIKPTSYLSRRLEDLYEGLVNTYNVDETFLAELPKTAYTAKDIEELRALKDKIEASMDEKPAEWSDEDNIGWDEAFACVTRAEKAAKNEEELQNAVTAEKWLKEIKFNYCVHPVKREWSEEDEQIAKEIEEELWYPGNFPDYPSKEESELYDDCQRRLNWFKNKLKSLRPQKLDASKLENFNPVDVLNRIKTEWPMVWEKVVGKQEWSEEDEKIFERFLGWLQGTMGEKTYSSWLKSVRERFNLQLKQEWSEEDENCLSTVIWCFEKFAEGRATVCIQPGDAKAYLKVIRNWKPDNLKSLRPQPHWKPSDEQMEALKNSAYGTYQSGDGPVLRDLYEQLKKLT